MKGRIFSIVTVFVIFTVFFPSYITAQTAPVVMSYYVKAGGNDANNGLSESRPFRTLAKAISSASVSNIKTITVIGRLNSKSENSDYSGDALFNINIRSAAQITIRGKPNSLPEERAILDAQKSGYRVLRISGSANIRLENIDITGGNSYASGGGIYIDGNTVLTIGRGTRIYKNRTNYSGGAISAGGGRIMMEDGYIYGNRCGDGGGGVHTYEGQEFIMSGGMIYNNTANWGGGVNNMGTFILRNGAISENRAIKGSGGVCVEKGVFTMENGVIGGNKCGLGNGGGGINIYENGHFRMRGGRITENEAGWGGGIYIEGQTDITGGFISGNTAVYGGGGIYVHSMAKLFMTGGQITNNEAETGGGLRVDGHSSIENTQITGNNADIHGGAVFTLRGSYLEMKNVVVNRNQSNQSGGGISTSGEFEIRNSSISDNQAIWGGGIYSEGLTGIWNSLIKGNRSFWGGGLAVNVSETEINNSEVSENYAFTGGGGLNINNGEAYFVNSTISGNKSQNGGGIYIHSGNVSIRGGSVSNNMADKGPFVYRRKFGGLDNFLTGLSNDIYTEE